MAEVFRFPGEIEIRPVPGGWQVDAWLINPGVERRHLGNSGTLRTYAHARSHAETIIHAKEAHAVDFKIIDATRQAGNDPT